MNEIILSSLNHTWILDLDGTIVKHNGYKLDGHDSLLPGVHEFFRQIPEKDMIIFVTSRKQQYKELTEGFLKENHIPFDHIIYDAPMGERVVINDKKPSGLCMANHIDVNRDFGLNIHLQIKCNL